ncbi:hypothetical protein [Streptomyces melanogenes]|uniref:hypothetical protein n=1 Tax=Streptomyces melanogenes TaxID=67326 RepID=UPI0037ABFBC3
MSDSALFQRIKKEETAVQQEVEATRHRLAQLEERLAELAITRRTITGLIDAKETGAAEPPRESPEPASASVKESPGSNASGGEQAKPRKSTKPGSASPRKPRGAQNQKLVILVASSDRPMRAKEIAIAVGKVNPSRSQVEAIRRALHKLASNGFLRALESGEFIGPAGAA